MTQAPVFICASFALRSLAGVELPWMFENSFSIGDSARPVADGMKTEGFAWFTDLSEVDPTVRLPLFVGLGYLLNAEVCGNLYLIMR